MTSPSSSISSSDARRYLATLALVVAGILATAAALNHYGLRTGRIDFGTFELYEHQRTKLRTATDVDTLFLGDSSLGNGIDAAAWSRETGRPALSLALTGAYGYAGSYNMLRQALDRGLRPRLVVIMMTAGMMERSPSWRGYLVTADGRMAGGDIPLQEYVWLHLDADMAWGVLRYAASLRRNRGRGIVNDYIPQRRITRTNAELAASARRLAAASINDGQFLFLRQIFMLCKHNGLNCVYAHGPLAESGCKTAAGFIARASAAIRSTGIAVVAGTPICLPVEEIGDSEDHVRPDLRELYTYRVLELVRSHANSADR